MLQAQISGPQGRKPALLRLWAARPKPRPNPSQKHLDERPNFVALERMLSEELGGAPQDHRRLALSLWALMHGTATLLLWKAVPPGQEAALRSVFAAAVRAMLRSRFTSSIRKSK